MLDWGPLGPPEAGQSQRLHQSWKGRPLLSMQQQLDSMVHFGEKSRRPELQYSEHVTL